MTRIDFYVLPDDNIDKQHIFACRLAQKASKQGHRVYIHTESEQQSKKLDDLLWSFYAHQFCNRIPLMPMTAKITLSISATVATL
jgi:DNA polymerase III, chi subunit